jgi:hypothetical protein
MGALEKESVMHRLVCFAVLFACSAPHTPPPPAPDASEVPRSPAGIFRVASVFDLAAPPAAAQPLLAALVDATDDPDDPGRYLVERVIAALPAEVQPLARAFEPLLAACVQTELVHVAPKLVPALDEMARELAHYARHIETRELWRIALDGSATRVVTGFAFGSTYVPFDAVGVSDVSLATHAALDGEQLAIAQHSQPLVYGTLLRLALDRAVIPTVDAKASDLARVLRDLVDCDKLGASFANALGFGPPSLYAAACDVALLEAADDFYARLTSLDASPVVLELAGSARALDTDYDGNMDVIEAGQWTGTIDRTPLGDATFAGTK